VLWRLTGGSDERNSGGDAFTGGSDEQHSAEDADGEAEQQVVIELLTSSGAGIWLDRGGRRGWSSPIATAVATGTAAAVAATVPAR